MKPLSRLQQGAAVIYLKCSNFGVVGLGILSELCASRLHTALGFCRSPVAWRSRRRKIFPVQVKQGLGVMTLGQFCLTRASTVLLCSHLHWWWHCGGVGGSG